jgi:hypothetical protein
MITSLDVEFEEEIGVEICELVAITLYALSLVTDE